MPFAIGEHVVIRERRDARTWTERPVVVISDDGDELVTYLAANTVISHPVGVRHGPVCLSMWRDREWSLTDKIFYAPGHIRIARTNDPFEVFGVMDDSSPLGVSQWYVNFQEILTRTPAGFDTMDEVLDLLVSPDCTNWTRKDEDELELAVSMGVYRRDHADGILERCRTVESQLASGAPPWDVAWGRWRPPTE